MTLSRTARILIAALLVAAAAFFWVNFFNQEPLQTPLVGQTTTTAPLAGTQTQGVVVPDTAAGTPSVDQQADASQPATVVGSVEGAVDDSASAAVDAAAGTADGVAAPLVDVTVGDDAQAVVTTPAAATPAVVDTAPPVIVTGTPTVVTRDLVVEDLPFLVTTPPLSAPDQGAAATASAERPQASQRSNINPFSPIVVQTPPSAPIQDFVAQEVPAAEPVIEIVTDGSGQPVTNGASTAAATSPAGTPSSSSTSAATQAAAPEVVRAPAPRAVAPATSAVSNLPRPLPAGTLPTTPEILRDARSQASTPTPTLPDVGTLAALRVPDENQPLDLATAEGTIPSDGVVTPDLIGPARANASTPSSATTAPLAVGVDQLSRYLRDNDVKFTGTVLGPLSVGVFRSNLYGSPVVLTLGQTLPETDILLTDLRGYEARFSLGDRTQTLALDLRR